MLPKRTNEVRTLECGFVPYVHLPFVKTHVFIPFPAVLLTNSSRAVDDPPPACAYDAAPSGAASEMGRPRNPEREALDRTRAHRSQPPPPTRDRLPSHVSEFALRYGGHPGAAAAGCEYRIGHQADESRAKGDFCA